MPETITVQRRVDGAYLVGDAPPEIDIARELLAADHDEKWMQVDGDLVTLTLTNGTWRYRIVERHEQTVRAVREVISNA
ncbi:MAG TPA: hypothetical protein VFC19_49295 [Candidatus Limnocylindrales bacterium]|nr:hypothetical protein [Candidatus Limnocylindrales bacterium]